MSTAPRFVSGPLLRTATSLGAPLHGGTRPLAAVAAAAPLAPATPPLPLILLLLVLFLLSMLFPQIVSVITMPLKTLFHGFRALFYPPWFYFLVMFFWYGYKYNWDTFFKLSATDQTCILGAFVLAFMQQFGKRTG